MSGLNSRKILLGKRSVMVWLNTAVTLIQKFLFVIVPKRESLLVLYSIFSLQVDLYFEAADFIFTQLKYKYMYAISMNKNKDCGICQSISF
jgi:hypothetical protein